MQERTAAPPALVEVSKHYDNIHKSSLTTVAFRIAKLRAMAQAGTNADPERRRAILEAAVELDSILRARRAHLETEWGYVTLDVSGHDTPPGRYFAGKRHVYSKPCSAQVWNNWRALRIVVNQIILLHHEGVSSPPSSTSPLSPSPQRHQPAAALRRIRRLSTDICISAVEIVETPRELSFLSPLLSSHPRSGDPDVSREYLRRPPWLTLTLLGLLPY